MSTQGEALEVSSNASSPRRPLKRHNAVGPMDMDNLINAAAHLESEREEPIHAADRVLDLDPVYDALPVGEGIAPAVQWAMTLNCFKMPTDAKSDPTPIPSEVFLADGPLKAKLLIYQKEQGQKTGYVHYQVAVAFEKKIRFTRLRELLVVLGYQPWLKKVAQKVDWNKWKAYCKKRDKPGVVLSEDAFVFGDEVAQGQGKKKETDMELAVKYVEENGAVTAKEFLKVFPNLHKSGNSNVLNYLKQHLLDKSERPRPMVLVFYGPTGTGKTFSAVKYCKERGLSYYVKNATKWWNGYQNEDVVIFDEFRGDDRQNGIPYPDLLQITGRLMIWIETKGGMVPLTCSKFIFTSIFSPDQWYPGSHAQGDTYEQFKGRMTGMVHFTVPYVHPVPEPRLPAHLRYVPNIPGAVVDYERKGMFEDQE